MFGQLLQIPGLTIGPILTGPTLSNVSKNGVGSTGDGPMTGSPQSQTSLHPSPSRSLATSGNGQSRHESTLHRAGECVIRELKHIHIYIHRLGPSTYMPSPSKSAKIKLMPQPSESHRPAS